MIQIKTKINLNNKEISESGRLQVSNLLVRILQEKLEKSEKRKKKLERKLQLARNYLEYDDNVLECDYCDKWFNHGSEDHGFCIKCYAVNCEDCIEKKGEMKVNNHPEAKLFCIRCLKNYQVDDC